MSGSVGVRVGCVGEGVRVGCVGEGVRVGWVQVCGCWLWARFTGHPYSLQSKSTGEHLEIP